MCDLINILSIIDDKTQLINFPKLDPNSFKLPIKNRLGTP